MFSFACSCTIIFSWKPKGSVVRTELFYFRPFLPSLPYIQVRTFFCLLILAASDRSLWCYRAWAGYSVCYFSEAGYITIVTLNTSKQPGCNISLGRSDLLGIVMTDHRMYSKLCHLLPDCHRHCISPELTRTMLFHLSSSSAQRWLCAIFLLICIFSHLEDTVCRLLYYVIAWPRTTSLILEDYRAIICDLSLWQSVCIGLEVGFLPE